MPTNELETDHPASYQTKILFSIGAHLNASRNNPFATVWASGDTNPRLASQNTSSVYGVMLNLDNWDVNQLPLDYQDDTGSYIINGQNPGMLGQFPIPFSARVGARASTNVVAQPGNQGQAGGSGSSSSSVTITTTGIQLIPVTPLTPGTPVTPVTPVTPGTPGTPVTPVIATIP